jgi:hypothetical protein
MDLGHNILTQAAINAQTTSAGTVTGDAIARTKYEGSVFTCFVGSIYGSPDATTVTFTINECATETGTYAAITDASAVITDTNGRSEIAVDLGPIAAYVKAEAVVSFSGGTSPYAIIGSEAIFGGSKVYPI